MNYRSAPTLQPTGQQSRGRRPRRRRPRWLSGLISFLRNTWRQLTSMRTALTLLFLLALASVPGALLPQWSLNKFKTQQYIDTHPTIGPLLDKLGFFAVFASPWYAAIYLLLFTSLVGCLIPRSWELARQLIRVPVACPSNLARLPHYARLELAGDPDTVAARVHARLGRGPLRWRRVQRPQLDGSVTVSAEKGYLREIGNLVFHLALLGLLVSFATGKLIGYEGSVLVTAGQNQGYCNSSPIAYDEFRPGVLVDGSQLDPFCVDVDTFRATYTSAGQASSFLAGIRYQSGAATGTETWQQAELRVNDPLRLPSGERIYLLGHGYTPVFAVTFPDGTVRDYSQPFEPLDSMFTSQGAVKITDPPGYRGDAVRQHQLAIVGVFAPSALLSSGILSSAFPAPLNPAVAIQVYKGDLGMADGRPQSVFAIDAAQVTNGALVQVGSANLTTGQSITIADGTKITFTGYREFVSLQTSYDPTQGYALVFVILLLVGLMLSLGIKRRRVWFRIQPTNDSPGPRDPEGAQPRVIVEVGGLARTDQAGYGAEFDTIAALAQAPVTRPHKRTLRRKDTTSWP